MNWDTTDTNKIKADAEFVSSPLTVTGIERVNQVPFGKGKWDCYLIKVKEDVVYRKNIISEELVSKNEIYVFQETYKKWGEKSNNSGDTFYWFVNIFGTGVEREIPFKGFFADTNLDKIVFCLDEKVNSVIKQEKKKWIETGYARKEDLKINNKVLVDAKYKALFENNKSEKWDPELNEKEKELIKKATTVEEIYRAQKEVLSLRGQKEDDNKIKELQKKIDDLKKEVNNQKDSIQSFREQKQEDDKRISELQTQNEALQQLKDDLQKKVDEHGDKDNNQDKEEIERLKKSIDFNREVTNNLQKDNEELRQKISELEGIISLQGNNQDINEIIEQAKNSETIPELEKNIKLLKSYRGEKSKAEVNQLLALLEAKLDANKSIANELNEGYQLSEEDIISDYQDHAKKIRNLSDQQEIEDFAKKMVEYLSKQKKTFQELNSNLERAKKLLQGDVQDEKNLFEALRQTRQNLDDLSEEEDSREARHAYQIINKEKEVTKHIELLFEKIEKYLETEDNSEEIKKVFAELNSKNYEKDTAEYKELWRFWRIASEFGKSRLEEKEIFVHPSIEVATANGTTKWKVKGKSFDLKVNFDGKELRKNDFVGLRSTFSHELAHTVIHWKELKKELTWHQSHSKAFWWAFRVSNDSTLNYVGSCLSPERRQNLKTYILNPLVINKKQNTQAQYRNVYFPRADDDLDEVGKEKVKVYLSEQDSVIKKEWNYIWQEAFKIVDSAMNKDPKNWHDSKQNWGAKDHWFTVWIKQPWESNSSTDEKKYKIYLFYIEEKMPEEVKQQLNSLCDEGNGWREKAISRKKARRISELGQLADNKCEDFDNQEAQIVVDSQSKYQ